MSVDLRKPKGYRKAPIQAPTSWMLAAEQMELAMEQARSEHRPHSLIASRRFWQCQAVIPGVCQAWGYAYENGNFNR